MNVDDENLVVFTPGSDLLEVNFDDVFNDLGGAEDENEELPKTMNLTKWEMELKNDSPDFGEFKYLSTFTSDDGVNFVESSERKHFPNCVNMDYLVGIQAPINWDLKSNFSTSVLNESYGTLRKSKLHFFIEWLMEKYREEGLTDFVTTSGALVELLLASTCKTVRNVFACKHNGTIYLSTMKSVSATQNVGGEEKTKRIPNKGDEAAFMHLNFVQFVTKSEEIREKHKFYSVYSTTFAGKSFSILSEVRAMKSLDENGEPKFIEVRCFDEARKKKRTTLKPWAQCVIGNKDSIVIGLRKENLLKEIQIKQVDDLINETHFSKKDIKNLFARVVEFVSTGIDEDDKVYEIRKFGQKVELVECEGTDGFLPDQLLQ